MIQKDREEIRQAVEKYCEKQFEGRFPNQKTLEGEGISLELRRTYFLAGARVLIPFLISAMDGRKDYRFLPQKKDSKDLLKKMKTRSAWELNR